MTTDPPARFRHRIPEIEAVQWTGSNADQLRAFCGPDFDEIGLDDRVEDPDQTAAVREADHGTWRGLAPGDWVVRLDGGLYEFSAADFAKQYEPAPSAAVSPPPATDRAGLLREVADECDKAGALYAARAQNEHAAGAFALMEAFLRKANEAEYVATPCDFAACEPGGEPCSVHERLMAHAEGDHELCKPDCGPGRLAAGERDEQQAQQGGAETRFLFWDESADVVCHDGRITIPVNEAANLAQFTPAGDLILQLPAARALRDVLAAVLAEDDVVSAAGQPSADTGEEAQS